LGLVIRSVVYRKLVGASEGVIQAVPEAQALRAFTGLDLFWSAR
jgi:hypothetical protein